MQSLTEKEAYLAMFSFLSEYYFRTESAGVGALLGDLSLLENGTPADPAAWQDWLEAVKKAKANSIDAALKLGS